MVTQKGVVWLRKDSWLVSVIIGMLLSVAISGAFVLRAQAEEVAPGDTAQSSQRGFNKTAVYRKHAESVLVYRTDASVSAVQFVVNTEPIQAIAGEAETVGDAKVWRLTSSLDSGAEIAVQTKSDGSDEWTVTDEVVALKDSPVLHLDGFTEIKGGPILEVRGSAEGVATDPITTIRVELRREGEAVPVKTVPAEAMSGVLARLQTSDLENGRYNIQLVADARDGQIFESDAVSVELYLTKPRIESLVSNQSLVYAFGGFTVSGKLATTDKSQAVLRFGDQSRGLEVSPDGSFAYTFTDGLAAGEYEFYVVATDRYGNTNDGARDLQGSLIFTVLPPTPVVTRPTPSLLDPIEKDTSLRLSTNFSTPLVATRSMAATQAARTANRELQSQAILGAESEALERAIDLEDTREPTGAPVEATPRGWQIFGAPWYWWMTGGMVAVGGSLYAYRWVVRRA